MTNSLDTTHSDIEERLSKLEKDVRTIKERLIPINLIDSLDNGVGCPECAKVFIPSVNYCPNCGHKLNQSINQ